MRLLSERLKHYGFAPGEKIMYAERLNIISTGAAVKGGKIMLLGNYWGEDMIITSQPLRDTRPATALTYMEISVLYRRDLEEVLVDFLGYMTVA